MYSWVAYTFPPMCTNEVFQKDERDSVTWKTSFGTSHYLGNSGRTKAATDYGAPRARSVTRSAGLRVGPGRQPWLPAT